MIDAAPNRAASLIQGVSHYLNQEPRRDPAADARRHFLAACGKFAIVTPPIVSLMLSQADRSFAFASSGGGSKGGDNHMAGGGGDGAPGSGGAPGGGGPSGNGPGGGGGPGGSVSMSGGGGGPDGGGGGGGGGGSTQCRKRNKADRLDPDDRYRDYCPRDVTTGYDEFETSWYTRNDAIEGNVKHSAPAAK
jgi:hypothetical protein